MGYHIQKCISESKYGFPVCGEETELKVDSMLIPPLAHKKYKEPASSQDLTSELQASALTPKQMGLPHVKTWDPKWEGKPLPTTRVRHDERFRKLCYCNGKQVHSCIYSMFVIFIPSTVLCFQKLQSRNISIIYQCIPLSSVGWSNWIIFSRTPGLESNALHVWDLNQICLVSVGWAFWVPPVKSWEKSIYTETCNETDI